MLKKETIEQRTESLLLPILEKNRLELVDLEYIKEGGERVLRVTLDKEGGLQIDDCAAVSRALSDVLDREDFIEEAYMLEVSSPGLLRPLKKEKDFARQMGKEVEIHLFKSREGRKEFVGTLQSYDKDRIRVADETGEQEYLLKEISLIRPYIDFSDL